MYFYNLLGYLYLILYTSNRVFSVHIKDNFLLQFSIFEFGEEEDEKRFWHLVFKYL